MDLIRLGPIIKIFRFLQIFYLFIYKSEQCTGKLNTCLIEISKGNTQKGVGQFFSLNGPHEDERLRVLDQDPIFYPRLLV